MPASSRKSQLVVFGAPNKPRGRAEKGNGSAPAKSTLAEAERQVLLQVIPDQVFRIKAKQDGSVSVRDGRPHAQVAADGGADRTTDAVKADQSLDPAKRLGEQLERRGKALVDDFLTMGVMQTLEFAIECGGRTSHYQVRAAACGPWDGNPRCR